ncbi:metal-sensing transcriptional repressor [Bacillus sp. V33-4]|uniref:metal-sensing transcriptional repressor n=1 Tax=Bacillus sp. V33-4 TaxID=2054169 RepID=UPI000C7679CB|nr:metal-sensing transcriptional repressor [Bacillus sp. V33-4]PLR83989.1 CsoR family transcriptional regulator [Bacillus sp. V33-4]
MEILNLEKPHCLDPTSKKKLVDTLSNIEGNVREINSLIEKDHDFEDIIFQIIASKAALKSVVFVLFEEKMKKCLAEQIEKDNEEELNKLFITFNRILKI